MSEGLVMMNGRRRRCSLSQAGIFCCFLDHSVAACSPQSWNESRAAMIAANVSLYRGA